jgi:hypothetical protein
VKTLNDNDFYDEIKNRLGPSIIVCEIKQTGTAYIMSTVIDKLLKNTATRWIFIE